MRRVFIFLLGATGLGLVLIGSAAIFAAAGTMAPVDIVAYAVLGGGISVTVGVLALRFAKSNW